MLHQGCTGILTVACVASLALPAAAARGGHGGGGKDGGGPAGGCATAELGLSTYTATAGVSSVGVYGPITNCGGGKARYTISDSYVLACGTASIIHVGSVSFSRGGESILVSTGFSVPANACAGTAIVTRTVSAGNVLTTASKELTIRGQ